MPLHTRIRAARQAKNLSQTAAAKEIGIPQSFMCNIEQGTRKPSVTVLSKIAKVLGVTETYLLGNGVVLSSGDNLRTVYDAEAVLKDQNAKPGLRDFAADTALTAPLAITEGEWMALRSLEFPGFAGKDDYLQLLVTIRAIFRKNALALSKRGGEHGGQEALAVEDSCV